MLCEAGFLDCHIQIPDLTSSIRGDMLSFLFLQKGVQLHPNALLVYFIRAGGGVVDCGCL